MTPVAGAQPTRDAPRFLWLLTGALWLASCASVTPEPEVGAPQQSSEPAALNRPTLAITAGNHPAAYGSVRSWREALADRLRRAGVAADAAHFEVAQHHERLAKLGMLPLPQPSNTPPAEYRLECKVSDEAHEARPVKGFVLGPIRSNDHLVTARVTLRFRVVHLRSQREVLADEVVGLGQTTTTITELNVGSYGPQNAAPDAALSEAAAQAMTKLVESVVKSMPNG